MALSVRKLCKNFKQLSVLKDLNLEVKQGQIIGCLGRNGAGKSTLIKTLMGLEKADSGVVSVLGMDPMTHTVALRRRIGYVAQEQHFYPWMTTIELGRFAAGFYPAWDSQYYSWLIERLDLPTRRKVGDFSGGMKAKTALALALAPRPDVLLLDEPAAGMDPLARREFLDLVSNCSQEDGLTALFSTHLVDDVHSIADQICIIEKGRNFYQGKIEPLLASVYSIETISPDDPSTLLPDNLAQRSDLILKDTIVGGRRKLIVRAETAFRASSDNAEAWKPVPLSFEEVLVALI